jgi:hypothetical protein
MSLNQPVVQKKALKNKLNSRFKFSVLTKKST